MESQSYSATIGGVVYNVTAAVGGQMDFSTDKTFGGDVTVEGNLIADAITGPTTLTGTLATTGNVTVGGDLDVTGLDVSLYGSKALTRGEGSPEGAATAPVGCIYGRSNGAANTALYLKESGSGNTGWVPVGRVGATSVLTAADGDATPTVLNATHLLIPANTAPTAITQLDGAVSGQQVTIVATNATNPSTIADGGNFAMSANWAPDINDTLTVFTANGTAWVEICRSAN